MKNFIFLIFICLLSPAFTLAQSVDILWQGNTYTPPFYKGFPQWSRQSGITLVAIPQGLGNAESLYYRWVRNGTVLGSLSGRGVDSLSFTDSVLSRPQTVSIEITSDGEYDSEILAKASVAVAPRDLGLLVYENNPLYGILFHREASGTYSLQGSEVSFVAFPLFFAADSRTDSVLSYKWKTNTGEVGVGSLATYRVPEESAGSSFVSIDLSNSQRIMQSAKKSFLVEFGNKNE